MKYPDLTGRAKIGFEEYDLCKHCILDIKRFINQGRADCKTENNSEKPNNSTISKMEQVDKDINVRSKDEPQTNADQHVQHVESVEQTEREGE